MPRSGKGMMPHEQPQETEPVADTPTREQRLEAALREIEAWVSDEWTNITLADIRNKCREALTEE